MPNFHHTPLTAAKAIRALVEDDIPKMLANFEAPSFERRKFGPVEPLSFGSAGHWMNAFKVFQLVAEQCNGLPRVAGQRPHSGPTYTGDQIQMAIQEVFPELFADYVEKLFEAEKSTLL